MIKRRTCVPAVLSTALSVTGMNCTYVTDINTAVPVPPGGLLTPLEPQSRFGDKLLEI